MSRGYKEVKVPGLKIDHLVVSKCRARKVAVCRRLAVMLCGFAPMMPPFCEWLQVTPAIQVTPAQVRSLSTQVTV